MRYYDTIQHKVLYIAARDSSMKKDSDNDTDDLRDEYDLSQLDDCTKGKYAQRYREGTNLVHLEPDVAEVFRDDESVNEALRSLIDIARRKAQPAR